MTLAAHTVRSWELFPHGLLVFQRADANGSSRMLISRVESCTTQGCSCRDVGLLAVAVDLDDKFDPASLSGDALNSRFETEALNARLGIDSGTVEPDDYEGRVPLSADWAEYLESQVDGELLDLLQEKWLRAKGMTADPKIAWEPRDPGDLVGWHEAHPTDRADLYIDEDGVFRADDLFCVKPSCSCNEAVVAFAPAERGASDIGSVRVRLPKLDVSERIVEPTEVALLDRLWRAFTTRHRHLADRLSHRKQQMAELASKHRQPPLTRSAERVGRNEPCPCGSGKKYKRCCG